MAERVRAHPENMKVRKELIEHIFGTGNPLGETQHGSGLLSAAYTQEGSGGDEFDGAGLQSQAGDRDPGGERVDGRHDGEPGLSLGQDLAVDWGARMVQEDNQRRMAASMVSGPDDFSHSLTRGWACSDPTSARARAFGITPTLS